MLTLQSHQMADLIGTFSAVVSSITNSLSSTIFRQRTAPLMESASLTSTESTSDLTTSLLTCNAKSAAISVSLFSWALSRSAASSRTWKQFKQVKSYKLKLPWTGTRGRSQSISPQARLSSCRTRSAPFSLTLERLKAALRSLSLEVDSWKTVSSSLVANSALQLTTPSLKRRSSPTTKWCVSHLQRSSLRLLKRCLWKYRSQSRWRRMNLSLSLRPTTASDTTTCRRSPRSTHNKWTLGTLRR